ncbi:MAG: hypothetical protein I8H86_06290 [Sphingomonadaceae bacterium]|nr:hypothetical protein [Sphingomonadaceae bacterium]
MGLALEKLPDWPAGMTHDLAMTYTGVSGDQMKEWERTGRVRFRARGPRGQRIAWKIDLDAALADLFGAEGKGGIEL